MTGVVPGSKPPVAEAPSSAGGVLWTSNQGPIGVTAPGAGRPRGRGIFGQSRRQRNVCIGEPCSRDEDA
jgi:hypothetical protein